MTRVDLEAFLSPANAVRAGRLIRKLARHDICGWVLAGSFALEAHLTAHRARWEVSARQRTLHDIDFVVQTFDRVPDSLAKDFAFRHIHPYDPPAKTLLQAIDLENALRVDVFRAYGSAIERSASCQLGAIEMRVLSLEDILARLARLSWNLALNISVGAKYVRDLLQTVELGDASKLQTAWQEHRTPQMPLSFREALAQLKTLATSHPELLITPVYSTDVTQTCERCHETTSFRLADAGTVLAALGYC